MCFFFWGWVGEGGGAAMIRICSLENRHMEKPGVPITYSVRCHAQTNIKKMWGQLDVREGNNLNIILFHK